MMTKYFHITITTALRDKDEFYVYFRGNTEDEIYYTLHDFIEDNLDEIATKYFNSDEIVKRGMTEDYYFHESEADYDEITKTEYREAMNQIFGNLD